jgi:hypothetical protein
MAHKWLGVDAGEKGGTDKAGEAVAFLQWSRKELEELKDGGKLVSIGAAEKEKTDKRKDKINNELASVNVFYKYYNKMNDTVCILLQPFFPFFLFSKAHSIVVVAFPARSNTTGSAVPHSWWQDRDSC